MTIHHVINNCEQGSFLGIRIDSKLNYKSHIDEVATKISKSIGILYKLSKCQASKTVLKQIYHSIVHSHLSYNIICYGGTYNNHLDRLLLLQKRAIRIITKSPYLAHTDPLFFSNKVLKIHDIYKLQVGLYMYDNWESELYDRSHHYDTRNRDSLLPGPARLTVTQNSLSVIGPNVWNTIPESIRRFPTKNLFKQRFKEHLLSNYLLNHN